MAKKPHAITRHFKKGSSLVRWLKHHAKQVTSAVVRARPKLKPRPRFVDVQGCPVPRQLAAVIKPSLAATGAALESCYRGSDPEGAAILRAHGKHTQEQLYEGWLHRLPGFNPANRPGTSTHELRSDGVAYPGPTGRVLDWWQCGMDIDDAHVDAFIRHLASRGISAHRPYPSGSEHHHVNLTKLPPARVWRGR